MPIESMLKLFFAAIGIVGEAWTGRQFYEIHMPSGRLISNSSVMMSTLTNSGEHLHEHNDHQRRQVAAPLNSNHFTIYIPAIGGMYMQHVTMYSSFMLGSAVEILIHYGHDLPAGLDYACGAIGFLVEAFIFSSHLHGKGMLDAYMHTLLVW
jgi:hypothetical protein